MNTFTASLISICMISQAPIMALADSGDQSPDVSNQSLSFENLRAACLNPARFHNQIAPKNIQVSCKDRQIKFVPDVDGALNMDSQRDVRISVMSDKYTASEVSGPVAMAMQTVACPQYKQIVETVEVIHATSCDELTAFSGSSVDFCVGTINTLRAANPSAVTITNTGTVLSLCAGNTTHQNR